MKRKISISILAALFLLVVLWMAGTGLQTRNDVILTDYSISADGTQITLHTCTASSMGYIRGFRDTGGGVKPHYLTFYATFGGLNSPLGSVDSVILELSPGDTEIYFSRPDGGYELVLQKNPETALWERPSA